MKKLSTLLILTLLSITIFAQVPQKMTYQAVIRDANANLITSHAVGMRLSILQGSASGTVVYAETQTSTTNTNGLLSIELGGGNIVSGTFASINWANGPYFIKTETDPTGGTNYSVTATSQLLSVPYALHAKTSENGFSGNYNDLTNKPTTDGSETKVQAGTNITVTGSGTNANPYIVNSSNSGTGITGTIIGDLQYWNGTTWVILHPGTTGQVLTLNSSNIPVWQTNTGGSSANVPQLTTTTISSITSTSSISGGNITSDGGYSVTARGVCWSTSPNPTTADSKTTDGSGGGSFTSNITGLMGSTTYYLRAYASNSIGTGYGMTLTFTTSAPMIPTVTTNSITNITQTTAKSGGNVTNNGGGNVTARGVCWSTSPSPTIYNYKTIDSSGNGSFVSSLTGLNFGTTYYLRSYATNSAGTSYGNQFSFTTLATLPSISTINTTNITSTSATSGIHVISSGGGNITASGICWNTSPNPTLLNSYKILGNGGDDYTDSITGLLGNTTYYVKAFATNSAGTAYGNEISFTTLAPLLANLNTSSVSYFTATSAKSGGFILNNGGGMISAKGVCWSTNPNPTISDSKTIDGNGNGSFSSTITGLSLGTTYYIRAYATNIAGTNYGNSVTYAHSTPYIFDMDGNGYDTVHIGTQIWMKQNLKTKKYNNNTLIPNVTDSLTWSNLTTPAYCNYNNDSNYVNTYGRLYNFYTLGNLCPVGWHVSSINDWNTLKTYLGGANIAGGKLKEIGLDHWISPNTGADNSTGFTAVPGGIRDLGGFNNKGQYNCIWNSDPCCTTYVYLSNNNSAISDGAANKKYGLSVRCVNDTTIVLPPTITTSSVSNLGSSNVTCGGNITYDGGSSITSRGVCWSTSQNPTVTNSKTTNGTGTGNFVSEITGLLANTTYYVRAYATNSNGLVYGNQLSFTTTIPVLFDIDGNGYDTVQIGTQIWMKQNLKATKYRNGDAIPNVTNNTTWGSLTTGAYCNYNNDTNVANTYGRLYNFYAVADVRYVCPLGWHIPSVIDWTILSNYLGGSIIAGGKLKEAGLTHWASPNTSATNETHFTALPGGYRHPNNGFFNIGNSGSWWSSTMYNTTFSDFININYNSSNANLSNVSNQTGWSVRCIRDLGAQASLPILTTTTIANIATTTATSGGNISSDGGSTVTSRGVCWSTSPNPTISNSKTIDGSGIGSYLSNITGLTANTTYYIRAYAINSVGIAYGNELSLITYPSFIYDIDSNMYDIIIIGTQLWMKQNLKTTKYRNAITIPNVTNSTNWSNLTTGAYCNYNNDTTLTTTYGRLYNFYAVIDTSNICPTGWHVPSVAEWTILTNFLGGENLAGGKLKEIGLTHWATPNTGASNESGFTALPSGFRSNNGSFGYISNYGFMWSTNVGSATYAYNWGMSYNNSNASSNFDSKTNGVNVRCIKD